MRLFRPRLFRPHRERKVVSARLLRPHRGRKAVSALSRCAVSHLEYHICSGIVKKKYLHCNSRPIITNTTNSNCQSNVVNAILSPDRMMPLHTRGLGSGSDWTFVKFGVGFGPRRHVGRCLRSVEHQGDSHSSSGWMQCSSHLQTSSSFFTRHPSPSSATLAQAKYLSLI